MSDTLTLSDKLAFTARMLSDAVNGNEDASDASEIAEWFRVGYLVEAANLIDEAVRALASSQERAERAEALCETLRSASARSTP